MSPCQNEDLTDSIISQSRIILFIQLIWFLVAGISLLIKPNEQCHVAMKRKRRIIAKYELFLIDCWFEDDVTAETEYSPVD